MKNFTSFINDATNRTSISIPKPVPGMSAQIVQPEAVTSFSESKADIQNGNGEKEANSMSPAAYDVDEQPKSSACKLEEETAQILKRDVSVHSRSSRSSSCRNHNTKKKRGRNGKLMNFDFKFHKVIKSESAEARNSTRIQPNDAVARKLATHTNTTNSILATVTFMPNNRTRFSSCLTINRNGSMRSVKSFRSIEHNESL